MNKSQQRITKLFETLRKIDPEPKSELNYTNDYTFLVSVALSAQATDVGVNKATKSLFEKVSTPQEMLKLGEEGLISYIKSIGLYRSKARNVISAAKKIISDFEGKTPHSQEDLTSLAGVGKKTAFVVRNQLWGDETIAVDTHVFRVAKRLGLAKGKTADKVADELPKSIPAKFHRYAHHWLILHGRYTCLARKPKCSQCPIQELCTSKDKQA